MALAYEARGGSSRGGSGRDVSSGFMEMEARVLTGGVGARGGGEAVRKIPVGGVGRKVGMAGDGVRL